MLTGGAESRSRAAAREGSAGFAASRVGGGAAGRAAGYAASRVDAGAGLDAAIDVLLDCRPPPCGDGTWFGATNDRAAAARALAGRWAAQRAADAAPTYPSSPPLPPAPVALSLARVAELTPAKRAAATGMALTPTHVGVGDSRGVLSVFAAADGELLHSREAHVPPAWRSRPLQVFAAADGDLFTVPMTPGRHGRRLRRWQAASGGHLGTCAPLTGTIEALACPMGGQARAITWHERTWQLTCPTAPAVPRAVPPLSLLAADTNHVALVCGGWLGLLRVGAPPLPWCALPWPGLVGATALAVGPLGVVIGDCFGGLGLWRPDGAALVLAAAVPHAHGDLQVMRVAISGCVIASHGRGMSEIQLRDGRPGAGLALLARLGIDGEIGGLALAGERLAVLAGAGNVELFALTLRRLAEEHQAWP